MLIVTICTFPELFELCWDQEQVYVHRTVPNSPNCLPGNADHFPRGAGRLEEALHDANELVKLAPQWHVAYLFRSIAHGKAGNEAEAKRDMDHATKLEQSSAEVQAEPYVLDCWKPAQWPAPRRK